MRVDVGLELLPAAVGIPDLLAPRADRQEAAEALEACRHFPEPVVPGSLPPPALGDVRERHDYTVRLALGESAEWLGVELQPDSREGGPPDAANDAPAGLPGAQGLQVRPLRRREERAVVPDQLR